MTGKWRVYRWVGAVVAVSFGIYGIVSHASGRTGPGQIGLIRPSKLGAGSSSARNGFGNSSGGHHGPNISAAGLVPKGQVIPSCTVPNTIALTFDDGPSMYTTALLDILRANDAHATFFVIGEAPNLAQSSIFQPQSQLSLHRMVAEGHQVGSHTYALATCRVLALSRSENANHLHRWTHPHLVTLHRDQIFSEMTQLDFAFDTILGYHPTYMRPPYLETNGLVLETLGRLGLHVVGTDLDTNDWWDTTPEGVAQALERFKAGIATGGSIALSHDIHETPVNALAPLMIQEARAKGLKMVTVGECLGDPREGWYVTG